MEEKSVKDFSKYAFWAVFILLLVLTYFIIKPYIIPLISAFILAYLMNPVYKRLCLKINKRFAAMICVLIVIIIIIIPLGAVIGGVIKQANDSLNAATFKGFLNKLENLPIVHELNIDLSSFSDKGINFIVSLLENSILGLPSFLVSLLIIVFGIYYILLEWDILSFHVDKYLPFKDKKSFKKEISEITNTIIYGTIFIGFLMFIVALVGFFVLGVKPFLLLSIVMFFLAFIPNIGPIVVWVPLAIFYFAVGNYLTAFGVIAVGLVLSILIDTMLRAELLGNRAKINPMIMLVGIIGGISFFGVFGFIIGPLVLIYTWKLMEELMGFEKKRVGEENLS